jgi:MFS family permease
VNVVEVGRSSPDPGVKERLPREIWVLVGTSFLIAIGYGIVAPTLPVFVRSFDVGITAASLVISVFALVRLLFAPVSGRIVARFGEVPTFAVGLSVVALSTGACAFAGSYWQLLVLRGLGGIGSTMFTVSALSLLIRLAPVRMRGRASGMWATGFLLGNVIGPLAGGGLAAVSLRAPFLVYAAVLVVVACVALLLLHGRDGEGARQDAAAEPPARFRTALSHPTYRAALVGGFATDGPCSACGSRWCRCSWSRRWGSRRRGVASPSPCSLSATRRPSCSPDGWPTAAAAGHPRSPGSRFRRWPPVCSGS